MDVASEVIELFSTRDSRRATELAAKLERLNRERRDAEAAALRVIEQRLAGDAELASDRLLVIDGEGWHRGVIGILASRVVERTCKPAIVVSVEEGVAHGSGRSVDGFQLLNALESCADLFTRFGGHAFAVGFALPSESLPELRRRLRLFADEHLAAREPERLLRIHAELPLDRITPVLAGWLRKLEPLGHGNPEPMFVARRVRLVAAPRFMKERHIRLELAQQSNTPQIVSGSSGVMRAVGWDLAGRAAELALKAGSLIDLVYRIRENDHPEFGGLEVEIAGMEIAEA
jgi:single-stranded-DNA-specific exonuclease